MKEKEIIEGNKLIVSFLDNKVKQIEGTLNQIFLLGTNTEFVDTFWSETIKYHSSWDWLMPVVEKIEKIGYSTSFKTYYCRINSKGGNYDNYIAWINFSDEEYSISRHLISDFDSIFLYHSKEKLTKLEAIYIIVIEFIKWYNGKEK